MANRIERHGQCSSCRQALERIGPSKLGFQIPPRVRDRGAPGCTCACQCCQTSKALCLKTKALKPLIPAALNPKPYCRKWKLDFALGSGEPDSAEPEMWSFGSAHQFGVQGLGFWFPYPASFRAYPRYSNFFMTT